MSQPVEVIMYKNPLEKAMWDTYMDDPMLILYVIGGCILLICLIVAYARIKEYIIRKNRKW